MMTERELRALYSDPSHTIESICEELGVCSSTLYRHLDEEGIDRDRRGLYEREQAPYILKNKSCLKRLYQEEGVSSSEIADQAGVSRGSVLDWLRRHGIEIRSRGNSLDSESLSLLELYGLYCKEKKSISDVAEESGLHWDTIRYRLEEYGIRVRSRSEQCFWERQDSLRDKAFLERRYYEEGASLEVVADELGVGRSKVRSSFADLSIKVRDKTDLTGELNPNWNGGYKYYYGTSWPKARRQALSRDDYICQKCGMTNQEHHREYDMELHVHHIRPFLKFDSHREANQLENLITVCRECHKLIEGDIHGGKELLDGKVPRQLYLFTEDQESETIDDLNSLDTTL